MGKTVQVKPIVPLKLVNFSSMFWPLTSSFWLFGFDLNQKPGGSRVVVKRMLRLVLRLVALLFVAKAIAVNWPCLGLVLKGKKSFKTECHPVRFWANTMDMVLGLLCWLALTFHEGRLSNVFGGRSKVTWEDLKPQNGSRLVFRARLSSVLAMLLALSVAVSGTLGLLSPSAIILKLASGNLGQNLSSYYNQICCFCLRLMATMFCCLYALACLNILRCLKSLEQEPLTLLTLRDFENRFTRIRRLVAETNAAFSGILPLLYLCLSFSMAFWFALLVVTPGMLNGINVLTISCNLFEFLCLFILPVWVNAKNNDISFQSPKVNQKLMQLATDPPRMTAGNHPIGSWIVVLAVLVSWLCVNLQAIRDNI